MSQIRFRDKVVDSSCTTENRQQRTDAKGAVPEREEKQTPVQRVQKKIEILQLQLVQETMRSEIGRMTLEKTFEVRDSLNQAVVRIFNEAARAWRIECLRYEIREIIPLDQAGNGDAGGSRSPQT